jgi:hypothetical protein
VRRLTEAIRFVAAAVISAALVSLVFAKSARAESEFTYIGSEFFRYSSDRKSHVSKYEDETSLAFSYERFSGFFRYSNYIYTPGQKKQPRLDKRSLSYQGKNYRLTAGTYSYLFGRGLTLSLQEQKELGFDNELEGVKYEWAERRSSAAVLYGVYKGSQKQWSKVTGLHFEQGVGSILSVGGSFVGISEPEGLKWERHQLVGVQSSIRTSKWNLYSEYSKHNNARPGQDGHGFYGNVSYTAPGISLAYSYKNYWLMQTNFNALPILRNNPENEGVNASDEKGYLAEARFSPFRNPSNFSLSYGQSNSHGGGFPYTELVAVYRGDSSKRSFVNFTQTYWTSILGRKNRQNLEWNYRLNKDSTVVVSPQVTHVKDYGPGYNDYKYVLEESWRGKISAVYTDERTLKHDLSQRWHMMEVKFKPAEKLEFGLTFGSRRAEYVCSGGVCRLEPAFNGFQGYMLMFF